MKKPFIGVIGFANAGKSSIIGSIAGNRTISYRGTIEDIETKQNIYVIGASPQKYDFQEKEYHSIMKSMMKKKDCRGVICSIQPTNARKRMSMEAMFAIAKKFDYELYAYVVDPPAEPAEKKRISDVAEFVKGKLTPFDVSLKVLSGQVFPYRNAQVIQKDTNIIG